MPLLNDDLSVWEIAHRWAGLDPDAFCLRLPLSVRDNCRILVGAIYSGELESSTLRNEKWSPEDGEELKAYFIRAHLDAIWKCSAGERYEKALLRWARIDRYEMKSWCESHQIPLPEFWFPQGWGLSFDWTRAEREAETAVVDGSPTAEPADAVRASTRTRIACQEIAKAIWKESPDTTIADMVRHDAVRRMGGGAYFSDDAVRGWLSAIAPLEVKAKRGRPRKNPLPGSE